MGIRSISILSAGFLLAAACAGCQGQKDPGTPDRRISAQQDREFEISLASNVSTGYSWEPVFDASAIELVGREYKADPAPPGMVGSGGKDFFRFKPLKSGETKVSFVYHHPWEKPTDADKREEFTVTVK